MKKIVSVLILIGIIEGCAQISPNKERIQAELSLKTDSTLTVDVLSHACKEYSLNKLIDSVRYVSLDNSDDAMMGVIHKIKIVGNLIYISDLTGQLKCFDKNGNYVREACVTGHGPKEIGHLIDFDVDENYLYILDGASIAIHVYNHDGIYMEKKRLPFRTQQFKCLSNEGYLFELAPYGINDKQNSSLVILTDLQFNPILHLLKHIDGAFVGISFENHPQLTYLYTSYGNGIYERRDSSLFMKYYLDFGGKYFNTDKRINGFQQAVDQQIYFTSNAPLHDETYLLQSYYAGLNREGLMLIRRQDNQVLFIENILQDKNDIFDFSFSLTKGYDLAKKEFFGLSNFFDVENIISDDKENLIHELRRRMPKEVQPFLIQNGAEMNVNYILMFYKLRGDIEFQYRK